MSNLPKPNQKFMSVNDLVVKNDVNIRFQEGQDVYGVKVVNGTYDLNSMEFDILNEGRIIEPITVNEEADGTLVVLKGNRRTLTGQRMLVKEETPKEVKDALNKTPVLIYKGLTPDQVAQMVYDQNSKAFLKSEMVRHICELNSKKGWDYNRIVLAYWRVLAQLTDSSSKKIEVEKMTNIEEQKKAIKAWFRGSVEAKILACNNLGDHVRRIMMREYMVKDGILKDEEQRDGVFTLDPKRLRELKAIQTAESATWNPQTGSPEFNKAIQKFIQEDATKVRKTPDSKPRPNATELLNRMVNAKSKAYKAALAYAQGDQVDNFEAVDVDAGRNEDVMEAIAKVVNDIRNPEIGHILRLVVFGRDIPELERELGKLTA